VKRDPESRGSTGFLLSRNDGNSKKTE